MKWGQTITNRILVPIFSSLNKYQIEWSFFFFFLNLKSAKSITKHEDLIYFISQLSRSLFLYLLVLHFWTKSNIVKNDCISFLLCVTFFFPKEINLKKKKDSLSLPFVFLWQQKKKLQFASHGKISKQSKPLTDSSRKMQQNKKWYLDR